MYIAESVDKLLIPINGSHQKNSPSKLNYVFFKLLNLYS